MRPERQPFLIYLERGAHRGLKPAHNHPTYSALKQKIAQSPTFGAPKSTPQLVPKDLKILPPDFRSREGLKLVEIQVKYSKQ